MKEEKRLGILLVEDDQIDQMNVKREFSKHNLKHELYIAENGEEAMNFLSDKSNRKLIQIILTDVNMPIVNGVELCRWIRSQNDFIELPIFVLTSSADDSKRIDSFNLNITGYIIKPLSFDNFKLAVNNLSEKYC